MSVNNSNQYTEVNNEIHGDYKFSESSVVNTSDNQAYAREKRLSDYCGRWSPHKGIRGEW